MCDPFAFKAKYKNLEHLKPKLQFLSEKIEKKLLVQHRGFFKSRGLKNQLKSVDLNFLPTSMTKIHDKGCQSLNRFLAEILDLEFLKIVN